MATILDLQGSNHFQFSLLKCKLFEGENDEKMCDPTITEREVHMAQSGRQWSPNNLHSEGNMKLLPGLKDHSVIPDSFVYSGAIHSVNSNLLNYFQ